ncbi:hypothetical protein [Dongia sp.]|uniref:hypothetical protein n=1 Tax=Dongia sp. TaxID=1977262 RepID=UPI0035AE0B96
MFRNIILSAALIVAAGGSAFADDAEIKAKAESFAKSDIAAWATDPAIVAAVEAANAEHAAFDQAKIDGLDAQWKAEVGAAAQPLIDSVVNAPISAKLKEKCGGSNGLVTEMILMDNKGLNVGVCDATSDYWQGDEGKWQKSFGAGAGAIFADDVEQDESTQRFQLQTSVTVVDASGAPIGALTVGLDAEGLMAQ